MPKRNNRLKEYFGFIPINPTVNFYEHPCAGTLSNISKAVQTEEMVLLALDREEQFSSPVLRYTSKKLKTDEICDKAVAVNVLNFLYTKYFDKQNIRLKAEDVGEKNLYGLYYDYDSSFEHGLWGAIRESSLLKCNNPAHKYHCVPDVEDETRLKTVLPDCIMIMNKTISFLDEIYGIPEQLLNEVIDFEIKPIAG